MYSSTWFDMHAILYPFQHVHEHSRAKSKENICRSSLNMSRTDKSHVSLNYKRGYQQYGSCMLILEQMGQSRPNKRCEQTFSVIHNAYVSIRQKDSTLCASTPQNPAD